MGIQRLGTAKEVAQKNIQVSRAFRGASFSTGLDGVTTALLGGNEDGEVGGRGGGIGLVWNVDVGGDGTLEDAWLSQISDGRKAQGAGPQVASEAWHTELVQLVNSTANLADSLLQSVGTILVVTEDGLEDVLEEAAAGVGSVQDADRGDGDGFGRVQAELSGQDQLLAER